MANAKIDLPNGTKVVVEGTPDEIIKVVDALNSFTNATSDTTDVKAPPAKIPKKKEKIGLTGLLLELKDQGFFKEKRGMAEIRERLESEGYIYPMTTLAPILINLTKSKELGRIKEDKVWKYVNR